MIFLPDSMNRRRSPDRSACPTVCANLGVLLDGVAELPVKNAPVGHDNDGVEGHGPFMLQADQLMGQPSDRVALAATGGMLDEVALACTLLCDIGKQVSHDV